MSTSLIIANWKMNPLTKREAVLLATRVSSGARKIRSVTTVLAPPFLFLEAVRGAAGGVRLCSQDIFWEATGPYTGAVSWRALKDTGVNYVIIGHSERKIHFGETDEMIQKKVRAALLHGFTAILCVGEMKREGNEIPAAVGEQLTKALRGISARFFAKLVVAYEPVWAVSTMPGAAADTPENAFRVRVFIKKILTGLYGRIGADKVRVIYGGSVKSGNVASFLREGKMEGALVGGASLDADEFLKIVAITGRSSAHR